MARGNFGGGDGTALSPFLIEDIYDFIAINDFSNHVGELAFKQVKDLDFSRVPDFEPISIRSADLIYDGNGKTIKNLSPLDDDTGCFVFEGFSSIDVKDIYFSNLKLISTFAASIFGYNYDTGEKHHKFENIRVNNSTFYAGANATALFLSVNNSVGTGDIDFINCTVRKCSISAIYASSLSAFTACSNLSIKQCEILDCVFSASKNGYAYISFFAQSNKNRSNSSRVLIENSYAKGNTINMSDIQYELYFGGFLNFYSSGGTINIQINKCYMDNDLNLISGADIYFGGFLGNGAWRAKGSCIISDSFLLGSVIAYDVGNGQVGELISEYGSSFSVSINNIKKLNTFSLPPNKSWNSDLDNQIGITITESQSKNKDTYNVGASWDFDEIWNIKDEIDTPFLRRKPAVIACKRVPLSNYRR